MTQLIKVKIESPSKNCSLAIPKYCEICGKEIEIPTDPRKRSYYFRKQKLHKECQNLRCKTLNMVSDEAWLAIARGTSKLKPESFITERAMWDEYQVKKGYGCKALAKITGYSHTAIRNRLVKLGYKLHPHGWPRRIYTQKLRYRKDECHAIDAH